jgi:hypothetical protein
VHRGEANLLPGNELGLVLLIGSFARAKTVVIFPVNLVLLAVFELFDGS